jgi:hypothetical protein
MEGLLILAVVAGVAVGVGFTTWQLSRQVKSRCTWVVDAAEDLSALEEFLNHLSEEGFWIHRMLIASTRAETERPAFVVVGRRAEDAPPERSWI